MDLKHIPRKQETKPRRFFKPRVPQCYRCSMPGLYPCECPGCALAMCLKHRYRKAGGNLCQRHQDAQLVQQDALPQTRFKDAGEAVPHESAKTDRATSD